VKMRGCNEDLLALVEGQITQEPGIWTCKLCRQINGIPEDEGGIIYCGLCSDYANPRKRERAERYDQPTLPGMDAPYQTHPPCRRVPLRKLRYLLEVLQDTCDLIVGKAEQIPDSRQARGWDWGTRYYEA
jgi:hypothetical protein